MDYIRRLIEQVAQMLAAIMGHRNAGRNEAAQQEIEKSCLQTAGLPLELVRQASPEALRAFLQTGGAQRHIRDMLLAELLLQDAELSESAGRDADALRCREHAFCLIMDALPLLTADDSAVYQSKLGALAPLVGGSTSDPYVWQRLARWSETKNDIITGSGHPG